MLVVGDPSPRTPVLFDGCLLLPISSTGALLPDRRPEAGYTYHPTGALLLDLRPEAGYTYHPRVPFYQTSVQKQDIHIIHGVPFC